MAQQGQTYANHARFHAPFHFFASPLLLLHLLYSGWRLAKEPSLDRVDQLVLSIALITVLALARINALKAQDRVIRLEERLRYERLLRPELLNRTSDLTEGQMVALRFAPDAELPGLIERTLAGQFGKSAEIKKAIVNWRGDYFRV